MRRTLDEQCQRLLHTILVLARRQHTRDGGGVPLEEYVDAGMEALCGCWGRYDATQQATFTTYATHRIRGAIQDAAGPYQAWRHLRAKGAAQKPHAWLLRPVDATLDGALMDVEATAHLVADLPAPLQPFAWHLLAGGTQSEYAAQCGRAIGTLHAWLHYYRKQYRQGRRTRTSG